MEAIEESGLYLVCPHGYGKHSVIICKQNMWREKLRAKERGNLKRGSTEAARKAEPAIVPACSECKAVAKAMADPERYLVTLAQAARGNWPEAPESEKMGSLASQAVTPYPKKAELGFKWKFNTPVGMMYARERRDAMNKQMAWDGEAGPLLHISGGLADPAEMLKNRPNAARIYNLLNTNKPMRLAKISEITGINYTVTANNLTYLRQIGLIRAIKGKRWKSEDQGGKL